MEGVIAIVGILFGILNIMLYFKIWGATNNIKYIKDSFNRKDNKTQKYISDILKYLCLGETSLADKVLDEMLMDELDKLLASPTITHTEESWKEFVKNEWTDKISYYNSILNPLNLTIPEKYKNINFDPLFTFASSNCHFRQSNIQSSNIPEILNK